MLIRANELKEVNLFLFTLYIIFIIIKIKNLFFFYFQALNTLSNSDSSLRHFAINEKEWDRLLEIEKLLKISLYI